jgi:hypothetical protein
MVFPNWDEIGNSGNEKMKLTVNKNLIIIALAVSAIIIAVFFAPLQETSVLFIYE